MDFCKNFLLILMIFEETKYFCIFNIVNKKDKLNHRVNDIEDCISKIDMIIFEINLYGLISFANNGVIINRFKS